MSLTTDPHRLMELVNESEMARDVRLTRMMKREMAAMGSMAMLDNPDPSPENLAFSVWSILAPQMLSQVPAMSAVSSGGHLEQLEVQALSHSVTQIARKQRMHKAMEPAAWDLFFKGYACLFIEKAQAQMSDLTKEERKNALGRLFSDDEKDVGGEAGDMPSPIGTPTPSQPTPPRWPKIKRLHPNKCGWDCKSDTMEEARFTWHEVKEDYEDLEERAAENNDDWRLENVIELHRQDGKTAGTDRGEVRYYVVYIPGGTIPGETPKPNQPGTIHTIACEADSDGQSAGGLEIRRPFYWHGHPRGPHIFGGQHVTGVDSFFLGLLGATEEAISMLDATGKSLHDRIRNHTRKHIYDLADEAQVQQIIDAEDGAYIGIAGYNDRNGGIETVESSVVSPAEVAEYREMQANASRQVGLSEAGQGRPNGQVSATADSIAANVTATKLTHFLSRWEDIYAECYERMAFELGYDDSVAVRLNEQGRESYLQAQIRPLVEGGLLSPEGAETIIAERKAQPLMYQGGAFADENGDFDWNNIDIVLVSGSMGSAHGEKAFQKESMWMQHLAQIGTLMVQQPYIRWTTVLIRMGRALGIPDADVVADTKKAAEFAQMQLAMGMGDPQLAGESPDPGKSGATLREGAGGARGPAGVDPGQFQISA